MDIQKLKHWERFYWKKADLVATVSRADSEKIAALEPKINLAVIPNGAGDEMIKTKPSKKSIDKPILFFIGNFYWLQNVEAAEILINKIYPLLIKDMPYLNIIIAGQNAENKLKDTKKPNLKIVDIRADDTKKVIELYQKATLFIAPIRGPGGTRLKILAAMAANLPIISTKIGIEGLDLIDNKNVLIADNPNEFVDKIKKILSNNRLYTKIQSNAYELVHKNYNWEKIAEKLEQVYKKLITD